MTTEGAIISAMIATLGYFLRTLVIEMRTTRETTIAMHETLKGATHAIVQLQEADRETSKQIINIVERLVRLEERTQYSAN